MRFLKLNNVDNLITLSDQITERSGSNVFTADWYQGSYSSAPYINHDYYNGNISINLRSPINLFDIEVMRFLEPDLYENEESNTNKLNKYVTLMEKIHPENGWRSERINSCIEQIEINGEIFLYVGCKYLIGARGSVVANPYDEVFEIYNLARSNVDLRYQLNTISVFKLSQFLDTDYDYPEFVNDESLLQKILFEHRTIKPLQRLAFRTIADFSVDETHSLDDYFVNMVTTKKPKDTSLAWVEYQDIDPFNIMGAEFTGTIDKIKSSFNKRLNEDNVIEYASPGNALEIITRPCLVPKKITSSLKTRIIDATEYNPTDTNRYLFPSSNYFDTSDDGPQNTWMYSIDGGDLPIMQNYNGAFHAIGPIPELNYKFPRYFWGDLNGIFYNYTRSSNPFPGEMEVPYPRSINRPFEYPYSQIPGSIGDFNAFPEEMSESDNMRPFNINFHSRYFRDYLTEEVVGIKLMDDGNKKYLFLSMGNRPHFEYASGSIISSPVYYKLYTTEEWANDGTCGGPQWHVAFEFIRNVLEEEKNENDVIIKLQRTELNTALVNERSLTRPQFLPDAIYRLELLPNGLIDTNSLITSFCASNMDLELDFENTTVKDVYAYQCENGKGINQQSSFSVLNHLIVEHPYLALRFIDGVKFEIDPTVWNYTKLMRSNNINHNPYYSGWTGLGTRITTNIPTFITGNDDDGAAINNEIYDVFSGFYSFREQLVTRLQPSPYLSLGVTQ